MEGVEVAERKVKELLFVPPLGLCLRKVFKLGRRRGRIGHLSDEIRSTL
jgi:hypothetical protein